MIDRKFRADAILGYGAQGVTVACSFAFMWFVTRFAGLETFGAVTVLVALSTVLSNLLSFRTNEAVVFFYKQGESVGSPARGKFALAAGVGLDLTVAVFIVGLLAWQSGSIAGGLIGDRAFAPDVRLYALVILFAFLRATPLAYLQATGRFRALYAIQALDQLLKVVFTAWFGLTGAALVLGDIVLAMLMAAACVSVPAFLYLAWVVFVRLRGVPFVEASGLPGAYARFSATTFLSSALKAGNQNIDTLVLGYLTDVRVAGMYGMFRQFVAPFAFLSTPFAALSFPRFVQAVTDGRSRDVRAAITQVNRRLGFAYAGASVVVVPLMLGYAWWMKIELAPAHILAFALMLLGAVNNGMLWWARPFSNSVDPKLSLWANLGATLFILLSIYPLTATFGIAGTAATMCALAVCLTGFWHRAMARHA